MYKDMCTRTDLAIEIQEKYEKDNVEISGVILKKNYNSYRTIKTTRVEIINSYGEKKMGRPKGNYITIENTLSVEQLDELKNELGEQLLGLIENISMGNIIEKVLVVGLGNENITPDAIGPIVINDINVSRHIIKECEKNDERSGYRYEISAIAPGVMGQTGMEVYEIISSIVNMIGAQLVIVVDALAARSMHRLGRTIQLTDTGIAPGSGVGNNRASITQDSIGVPVIAIGVPTVVDAYTITYDMLEKYLEKEGLSDEEIASFNSMIKDTSITNMYVTPKNIDEVVKNISKVIAKGINKALSA